MELSAGNICTAQDLYEFLSTIPTGMRERLPLEVVFNGGNDLLEAPFSVEAFEVTETEGCIERGLRLSKDEDEDQEDE